MIFRRRALLLAWAVASAALPSQAGEGRGPASRPVVQPPGRLVWVEPTGEGGLRLVTVSVENPRLRVESNLASGDGLDYPQLRLDAAGRPWVAAVRGGRVVFGQPSGLLAEVEAGPGSSAGPDLCFDSRGGLWLAWRQAAAEGEFILVREVSSSRTWILSRPDESAHSFPRLVSGNDGRVWAVWTGKDDLGYGVFAQSFNGQAWSTRKRLAQTGDRPCLAPDAALDLFSRPWVVWSAYDGSDYEIYLAKIDREIASPPLALTRNASAADASPALAILDGRFPVVAWKRTDGRGTSLQAVLADEDFAFDPAAIASSTAGSASPPWLAADGPRVLVAFSELEGFGLRTLDEGELKRRPSRRRASPPESESAPAAAAIIFNPALDENAYVCFGDSITYGHLAGENAPDKGYPPRLDLLLDPAFGPTRVWNDGVPGEYTAQGLARFESLLAARKARYVLILEGTNDVKAIENPIEASIFNLKEVVRKALAYGAFPAIATVIPRRDWIWYFPEYAARHNALVAGVQNLAAELKVPLLDLNQEFNAYPGGPEALLDTDGKHPNEKGYQVMAERWFAAIGKFPFPATDLQALKKYDKILFFRLPGNMLTWKASLKVAVPAVVQGYKIYRRKPGEGVDKFRLLLLASGSYSHFDTDLQGTDVYEYVLATLRTDGVEGPCSALARSR
jgi:lysophospholipase L1-like esterase